METSRRGMFGLFASLPFVGGTSAAEGVPLADETVMVNMPRFIVINDTAHALLWSNELDPTIW